MSLRLFPILLLIAAPALAQRLPYELTDEAPPKPAEAPAAATPAAPANPYMQDETKAEAEARANVVFDRMDLDHDGFITMDEATAFFAARAAQAKGRVPAAPTIVKEMFDDADTDHDGKISRPESKAAADRGFDEVDTNHDGVVTPAERMAATQEVMSDKPKVKGKPQESGR